MLVRWLVIGGVAVLALTVYALVDLFVTQSARVRAFPKPVWIAVIVVLPLLGPVLWLFVGKNRGMSKQTIPMFPDDDMGFLGRIDRESAEDRIRRLEEELRQLDEEDLDGDTGKKKPKNNKTSDGDSHGDDDTSESGGDDDGDGPVGGAGTPSKRS
jgi:hypothetical protein